MNGHAFALLYHSELKCWGFILQIKEFTAPINLALVLTQMTVTLFKVSNVVKDSFFYSMSINCTQLLTIRNTFSVFTSSQFLKDVAFAIGKPSTCFLCLLSVNK